MPSTPSGTPTVITADDIAEPRDYDPQTHGSPNTTDYNFPKDWGLYTDQMRHEWFTNHRVATQVARQDTPVGRRARQQKQQRERLDTDSYRYDTGHSE